VLRRTLTECVIGGAPVEGGGEGAASASAGLLRPITTLIPGPSNCSGARRCGAFTPTDDLAAILVAARPRMGFDVAANVARATVGLPELSAEAAAEAIWAREDQEMELELEQEDKPYSPPFYRSRLPLGTAADGSVAAFDTALAADATAAAAAACAAGRFEAAAIADSIATDTTAALAAIDAAGGLDALGLAGGGPDIGLESLPGMPPTGCPQGPWEGYSHRRSVQEPTAEALRRYEAAVDELCAAEERRYGPGWMEVGERGGSLAEIAKDMADRLVQYGGVGGGVGGGSDDDDGVLLRGLLRIAAVEEGGGGGVGVEGEGVGGDAGGGAAAVGAAAVEVGGGGGGGADGGGSVQMGESAAAARAGGAFEGGQGGGSKEGDEGGGRDVAAGASWCTVRKVPITPAVMDEFREVFPQLDWGPEWTGGLPSTAAEAE